MRFAALAALLLVAACSNTPGTASDSGNGAAATQPGATGDTGGGPTSGGSVNGGGTGLTCWNVPADGAPSGTIAFSDQTEALGLVTPLTGMHGHAAIWADVNADGRPDLYVGTFADRDIEIYQHRGAEGPSPDRLLLNTGAGFEMAAIEDMRTRTSGGVGADLDSDGDIDLVVARNRPDPGTSTTIVLENDDGVLSPVELPGLGPDFGGRTVALLDFDRDGAFDLFIAEDRWSGERSVLMRNEGGMAFSDVTAAAGLPDDIQGLGATTADLNGDLLADIFVGGSNRMFLANGDGTFREADVPDLAWDVLGPEDDVAGVSVADVNRDGTPDLLVGHHYNSTVEDGATVAVRLYLNRGPDGDGVPQFEDVTEEAGLIPLPTKAAHVELNDFDNDGWLDILTTASAGDGTMPALFRFAELRGDVPYYEAPSGLGSDQYWIGGPSTDYDRDGRLDVFLVEWEPALPSILLHNDSVGGHWLEVSVAADHGYGIGWLVEVFAGPTDDPSQRLGAREITVTQGYSSGVEPIAHFGLGEVSDVTVRLTPKDGSEPIVLTEFDVDSHIRYPDGC